MVGGGGERGVVGSTTWVGKERRVTATCVHCSCLPPPLAPCSAASCCLRRCCWCCTVRGYSRSVLGRMLIELQPRTRLMSVRLHSACQFPQSIDALVDLSHLKAMGRPEGSLPWDVRCQLSPVYPLSTLLQIQAEAFIALILGTLGACLRIPPLKEISWASEMRTRCV